MNWILKVAYNSAVFNRDPLSKGLKELKIRTGYESKLRIESIWTNYFVFLDKPYLECEFSAKERDLSEA